MKEKSVITLWIVIGAALIIGLWFLSFVLISTFYSTPTERGTFGDMFGAINALFSGLAFLGLIIALILQKKELEEQRKEIGNSIEAQERSIQLMKEQAEISLLQTKLEALNHIINGYERSISRAEKSKMMTEHVEKENLVKARDNYENLLKELINKLFIKE